MFVVRLILFSVLLYNIEAELYPWFYKNNGTEPNRNITSTRRNDLSYQSAWMTAIPLRDTYGNVTRLHKGTFTDYNTTINTDDMAYVTAVSATSTAPPYTEAANKQNSSKYWINDWTARLQDAMTTTRRPYVATPTTSSYTDAVTEQNPYKYWITDWTARRQHAMRATRRPYVATPTTPSYTDAVTEQNPYNWITDWTARRQDAMTTTRRPYVVTPLSTTTAPYPKPAPIQNVTVSPIITNLENPINISINSSTATNEAQNYSAIVDFVKKLARTVWLSAGTAPYSNISHLAVANGNGNMFFYVNN